MATINAKTFDATLADAAGHFKSAATAIQELIVFGLTEYDQSANPVWLMKIRVALPERHRDVLDGYIKTVSNAEYSKVKGVTSYRKPKDGKPEVDFGLLYNSRWDTLAKAKAKAGTSEVTLATIDKYIVAKSKKLPGLLTDREKLVMTLVGLLDQHGITPEEAQRVVETAQRHDYNAAPQRSAAQCDVIRIA